MKKPLSMSSNEKTNWLLLLTSEIVFRKPAVVSNAALIKKVTVKVASTHDISVVSF